MRLPWEDFHPWEMGTSGGDLGAFAAGKFCEVLPFSRLISLCAGPVPQAHGGVPAGAEE